MNEGLRQILEVYRLVHRSRMRRIAAANQVAQQHRITRPTVMASCTTNIGISTYDFDHYLAKENAPAFRDFLVRRFPQYQDEIDSFFAAFLPTKEPEQSEDANIKTLRTMFPDEIRNHLNKLLVTVFSKKFSEWETRKDIPIDVRRQITEWQAMIQG